jgi:uncharacterized protein
MSRVNGVRALVVTGGHRFEAAPFFAIFDAVVPGRWHHVAQPDALDVLNLDGCKDVDVVVFYDIPGLRFTGGDPPAEMWPPPVSFIEGFRALRNRGIGLVFLHHAVAGWPLWEEYAEAIGARFHYQPGTLRGVAYPDSGYVFDVTHHVSVIDPTHPICAGLGTGFDLTDELYCYPVLTDSVVPLLRTSFPVGDTSQFFSTDAAIRGRRNSNDGWTHPAGSDLVGWVKSAGRSPVVYLQFGDGPTTYTDPSFRRVLSNSMAWAASDDARVWAAARSHASP